MANTRPKRAGVKHDTRRDETAPFAFSQSPLVWFFFCFNPHNLPRSRWDPWKMLLFLGDSCRGNAMIALHPSPSLSLALILWLQKVLLWSHFCFRLGTGGERRCVCAFLTWLWDEMVWVKTGNCYLCNKNLHVFWNGSSCSAGKRVGTEYFEFVWRGFFEGMGFGGNFGSHPPSPVFWAVLRLNKMQ